MFFDADGRFSSRVRKRVAKELGECRTECREQRYDLKDLKINVEFDGMIGSGTPDCVEGGEKPGMDYDRMQQKEAKTYEEVAARRRRGQHGRQRNSGLRRGGRGAGDACDHNGQRVASRGGEDP